MEREGSKKTGGKKRKQRRSKSEMVEELLKKVEDQVEAQEIKVTVNDFVRLIQLKKELEQEEPVKEIEVRWVDGTGEESADRK